MKKCLIIYNPHSGTKHLKNYLPEIEKILNKKDYEVMVAATKYKGHATEIVETAPNVDLVMSFGTLHFVDKNGWKQFISNAKDNTNVGGIHIMQIFTDVVPASADIAPFAIGLAKDEEIKDLYSDWEILQFKSYVFEDEHPNVPGHLHASNKIVARRIK